MRDECKGLFSGAYILLENRRRRLQMDIIEANKCLRSSYGPPKRGAYNDIGHAESLGASQTSPISNITTGAGSSAIKGFTKGGRGHIAS
jgi:hypothetical protein